MTDQIDIVGAGMAGLLSACILRERCSGVFETQPHLPNNHHAVLRFRSSVVADTVNIPFQKVQVMKAAVPWKNPVADALAYSRKTNGKFTLRSSTTADGSISERYIAPPDFISQLFNAVESKVQFNCPYRFKDIDQPVISTIPMPSLMAALEYEHKPKFESREGVTIVAKIEDCNAYCSLYVPDPLAPYSRISITGDRLMVECRHEELFLDYSEAEKIAYSASTLLGFTERSVITEIKSEGSKYAKILPINEHERKKFILWASETHGIYSVGRFATWRPGLLLDDVVHDVRVVQELIRNKHAYDHKRRM